MQDLGFCPKGNQFPFESVTVALFVWVTALLGLDMRETMQAAECLHANVPAFVWETGLEEARTCTLYNGPVCSLNHAVGLVPVRIRLVVTCVEISTSGMGLVCAVTVPVRDRFGSFEVNHRRFDVGDRFTLSWISRYPVCTALPGGQGGAVYVAVHKVLHFEDKKCSQK